MDFTVKMLPHVGDKTVSKATITVHDANGIQTGGQYVLEGETAETRLTLVPGGEIRIKEAERPLVYDQEQKAAVPMDLTPDDKLSDPNRPKPGQPLPGAAGMGKAPEAGHATASGSSIKPNNVVDTKPATSPLHPNTKK